MKSRKEIYEMVDKFRLNIDLVVPVETMKKRDQELDRALVQWLSEELHEITLKEI